MHCEVLGHLIDDPGSEDVIVVRAFYERKVSVTLTVLHMGRQDDVSNNLHSRCN